MAGIQYKLGQTREVEPKDLAKAVSDEFKFVDLKFTDLIGALQTKTIPAARLEEALNEGIYFDGSSIRGFQEIQESDMLLKPQADAVFRDPFAERASLNIFCDVYDPQLDVEYSRDPRRVARDVIKHLNDAGIAEDVQIGPEAEFYVFHRVLTRDDPHHSFFQIIEGEGGWMGDVAEIYGEHNSGHRPPPNRGYIGARPQDRYEDLRKEMMLNLQGIGLVVEAGHHEVGDPGQAEINIEHLSLLEMGDAMMAFKYVIKNTADLAGRTATFMPKPIFGINGSGMHTHMSFWKDKENIFAGNVFSGLSQEAMYAMGGILKYAHAISAFANPTTNSYRRLVDGYEAPTILGISASNRSAAIRIPITGGSPGSRRFEVRFPDPSANPYLVFSALAMAAAYGIEHKIQPSEPILGNFYELGAKERGNIPTTPKSLEAALEALDRDRKVFTEGGVFTDDLIDEHIEIVTEDIEEIRLLPTPRELQKLLGV